MSPQIQNLRCSQATNYVLAHQEEDSGGEIQTKMIKVSRNYHPPPSPLISNQVTVQRKSRVLRYTKVSVLSLFQQKFIIIIIIIVFIIIIYVMEIREPGHK